MNCFMKERHGLFLIVLDFEMLWGVEPAKATPQWRERVANVHRVIPRLLELFGRYDISATFAAVGMLLHDSMVAVRVGYPDLLPSYADKALSPYSSLPVAEEDSIYYCGGHLLEMIRKSGKHEIASHTYSHYYCLAQGQTPEQFRADLQKNISLALDKGIKITSLVFPRNEFNIDYLNLCRELCICVVRSNPGQWMWKDGGQIGRWLPRQIRRALRLLDCYTGPVRCFQPGGLLTEPVVQLPGSRFCRPVGKSGRWMDSLRLRRIEQEMTYAAKNNQGYCLWWHPHNMGRDMDKNFSLIEKILSHYESLRKDYGFQSVPMNYFANIGGQS